MNKTAMKPQKIQTTTQHHKQYGVSDFLEEGIDMSDEEVGLETEDCLALNILSSSTPCS
jgi:hypothetical protein